MYTYLTVAITVLLLEPEGSQMKRIKIASFILISMFLLSFLPIIPIENFSEERISNFPLKISSATILIDGNAQLAANASRGAGNSTHPYVIENYIINGTGLGAPCIEIKNTNAYFILKN